MEEMEMMMAMAMAGAVTLGIGFRVHTGSRSSRASVGTIIIIMVSTLLPHCHHGHHDHPGPRDDDDSACAAPHLSTSISRTVGCVLRTSIAPYDTIMLSATFFGTPKTYNSIQLVTPLRQMSTVAKHSTIRKQHGRRAEVQYQKFFFAQRFCSKVAIRRRFGLAPYAMSVPGASR
eukprot:1906637-Rhodomonas_salina.1